MKFVLNSAIKHMRTSAWIATLLMSGCAAAWAQSLEEQLPPAEPQPSQQQLNQNKIRALAVIETTGAANPRSSKLVKLYPVLILYKGAYQDASMYDANPVPMALGPGTVYEVEGAGEPVGLVTTQQPRDQQGNWLASGAWIKQNAQKASAKSRTGSSDDDERPTLKHASSGSSETSSSSPPTSEPAGERPSPTVVHHEASGPASDPDRPILRRGRSEEEQAAEGLETQPTSTTSQKMNAPAAAQVQPGAAALPVHDYAAISDPSAYDTRTLAFPWTAGEKKEWSAQLTQMALRKLRQYAQGRGLTVSAATPLQELDIRAFDLFSNNDAQLVITGSVHFDQAITRKQRVPIAPASVDAYFALVVYRDLDGNMDEIFSSVTDNQHLDVEGRLKLVDAVDVNGDGHGELLFKRAGADSDKFELYRVGGTQLYKLFEGAEFSRAYSPSQAP